MNSIPPSHDLVIVVFASGRCQLVSKAPNMKCVVLVLVLAFGLARAHDDMCCKLLHETGLSENFNETIAHAVHSMTVQGLQLFNPRATENNQVPTVNMDRHSSEKVVPYAPNDFVGSAFSTLTMNSIDKILLGIGKDSDGLGPNWSPLERVVHKFHMWDVWNRVHQVYVESVVEEPPSNVVCNCLMDTANNGIYKAVKWVSDHYDSGTPITLLNRPIPKLTDAASWSIWRERLLWYYKDSSLHDAAVFLYCATKDF